MARSDLLISLVRAARRHDDAMVRRTVEALAAEERDKQHHALAERLEESLRANGDAAPTRRAEAEFLPGVEQRVPRREFASLILSDTVRRACEEFVDEQQRSELLRSFGLEPRNRALLIGPPGNGKSTLAEAIATALIADFLVVRYEEVIGSYLGETAGRLKRVFDFARARRCVLFLDEFDALGKERGDLHETGEIKRVVSSLLLQIDALPPHVVLLCATNHPELLDKAAWRRFQLRLVLPPPTPSQVRAWLHRFESDSGIRLPLTATLERTLRGLSFSELEEFTTDIRRQWVLRQPDPDITRLVRERVAIWDERRRASV